MSNHLNYETSPYLLQHVDNPVDWYPWGATALQRAKTEDKPIFLSIGYAACHWCHVMAHESFEDDRTADFLNANFINIKVDREERPDLDSIYMEAVVAMTKQGGWPMTVFLTPEGAPFWGGTYFPPTPRHGMPSFMQVIQSIAEAWQNQRGNLLKGAEEVTSHIRQKAILDGDSQRLSSDIFTRAVVQIGNSFDARMGGFGRAPKFPPSMTIEFLLRHHQQTGDTNALHMAEHTLEMMARGGMYDQIGGGFARYSTDNDWLVPHFEKMLYDNALLTRVYLHAWQVTGKPLYKRIVQETLDWAVKEMHHADGGFYSSYDADSEGEEGKFYVWQPAEVREILGGDAPLVMAYYDISERGNWEGNSIPHIPRLLEEVAELAEIDVIDAWTTIQQAKQKLYDHRTHRIWPGLDDKVLTAWNGLMLASFAEVGRVLNRPDYTAIAVENAEFLYHTMRTDSGRLLRTWKAGSEAKYNAYLEDYAYLAEGLLALYQTTFEERWFVWAKELATLMITHFRDEQNGGFYDTSDDHETLIHRPKDIQDNAVPSGNAVAAGVLAQLSLYTGNGAWWDVAQSAVAGLHGAMSQYPTGFGQWLQIAAFMVAEPQEIAIVGDKVQAQPMLDVVQIPYRPFQVVALVMGESVVPLLADRVQIGGEVTGYVCRHFTCQLPVTTPEALTQQLGN